MPPKKASNDTPPGIPISLRFKYGIHTFFIFVEPNDPFSAITKELIEALHDRAEPILATKTELTLKLDPRTNKPELDPITGEEIEEWVPADPVPVPSKDEELQVDYGVLNVVHDVSKGYSSLNIQPDDTPTSLGFKNNTELAFVVRRAADASGPPDFQVKLPAWEAEEDEQEEEDAPAPKGGSRKGKGKGKERVMTSIEDDEEL